MRLLMIAAACVLTGAAPAQQAQLPQIRSADGKVVLRAQPTQTVDETGSAIDPRAPLNSRSTSTSVTIATADTFQSVLPANERRLGCLIQNKSTGAAIVRVYLGAPAAAASGRSMDLDAGDIFSCATGSGMVVTDEVSVASSEAGTPVVVVSQ